MRFDKLRAESQMEILNGAQPCYIRVFICFHTNHDLYLSHITNDVIVNIDPEWKFAVFLRDPAERLLSAYLDKVNGTSVDERNHFLKTYNLKATPTFEEFIKAISKNRTEFEFRSESETKLQGVDWCELLLQGIIHRRTCDSNRTLKFLFTLH